MPEWKTLFEAKNSRKQRTWSGVREARGNLAKIINARKILNILSYNRVVDSARAPRTLEVTFLDRTWICGLVSEI